MHFRASGGALFGTPHGGRHWPIKLEGPPLQAPHGQIAVRGLLFDCCAVAGTTSPTARIEVIKNGCNLISLLPSIRDTLVCMSNRIIRAIEDHTKSMQSLRLRLFKETEKVNSHLHHIWHYGTIDKVNAPRDRWTDRS
jgi:hypothetical protein